MALPIPIPTPLDPASKDTWGPAVKAGIEYVNATADANAITIAGKVSATSEGRDGLAVVDYAKLRPFFAALANRRRESVSIAVIGDSGVEGYRLSAWDQTLPSAIQQAFRDRYPSGVTGARGFISVTPTNTGILPYWPVVNTGGTVLFAGGHGNKAWRWTAAGKSVLTVQAGGLSSFELHFIKQSTGATNGAYYKIDGGTAVNFDTNNATTIATSITVNSAVTSTIEVGWNSARFDFTGFREYKDDSAKGVQVHNLGFSGSTSYDWYSTSGSVNGWAYFLPLLNPKLVVFQIGGNDNLSNVATNATPVNFGLNIQNTITAIRARGITAPIVYSMCYDISPGAFQVAPWAEYLAQAKAVAANNAGVVYTEYASRIYPSSLTDPDALFLTSPNYLPHESARGAALMAETLVSQLSIR